MSEKLVFPFSIFLDHILWANKIKVEKSIKIMVISYRKKYTNKHLSIYENLKKCKRTYKNTQKT